MAQDNDKPENEETNKGETVEGEWRETDTAGAADLDPDSDNGADVDLTLPEVDKTPKRNRLATIVGLVVLLFIIAAIAGAGYFGWQASKDLLSSQAQARGEQAKLANQIQDLVTTIANLKSQQRKQDQASNQNLEKVGVEINRLEIKQGNQSNDISVLQNSMAEVIARSGTEQTGWQLAEAEWLIWLANMRLQLQEQYTGAVTALEQADQLLQKINHPRLRSVRATLADEILAVKTAERPDIDSIALSLLALSNQANQLPLPARPKPTGEIQKAEAAETKPEGWKAALAGLWQEIRGLVVIRRQEKNLRPWLSDREEQLIYQGLQVRLDAARLAALRGKSTLFEQSVRSAQTWLLTWFDTQTAAVEAVDSELSALAKQHLAHNPPDISQSLSQLRQLRQQGLK